MTNNIIEFPFNRQKIETIDINEEIINESGKVAEDIAEIVLSTLIQKGCKYDHVNNMLPHIMLMFESIRSLYLLSKGEEHPIQQVANVLFDE